MPPRILITPGEPAGIGPELVARLAMERQAVEVVAVADPELLRQRAGMLGLSLVCEELDPDRPSGEHRPGHLPVLPVPLATASQPGRLDPRNAEYVLETLRVATDSCLAGHSQALVTAPVQKSVINEAGIRFSGHTEFLAERCAAPQVVMMLATAQLRVALVTTHLPLRAVPDAINRELVESVIRVLHESLRRQFGLDNPRITVLGLNPHAGEGGHLGREELDIIEPCLRALRSEGLELQGPLPADTAFTPEPLSRCDAVLAMYHDQGLPVLKHQGFGSAVNITLGLPIIRTSVDHGTALDLAGSGRAEASSLQAAVDRAVEMIRRSATP